MWHSSDYHSGDHCIQLPQFNPANLELWLVMCDMCFRAANVSSLEQSISSIFIAVPPQYAHQLFGSWLKSWRCNAGDECYQTFKMNMVDAWRKESAVDGKTGPSRSPSSAQTPGQQALPGNRANSRSKTVDGFHTGHFMLQQQGSSDTLGSGRQAKSRKESINKPKSEKELDLDRFRTAAHEVIDQENDAEALRKAVLLLGLQQRIDNKSLDKLRKASNKITDDDVDSLSNLILNLKQRSKTVA